MVAGLVGVNTIPLVAGLVCAFMLFSAARHPSGLAVFSVLFFCLVSGVAVYGVRWFMSSPLSYSPGVVVIRNDSDQMLYFLSSFEDDRVDVLQYGDAVHSFTKRAAPGDPVELQLEAPVESGLARVTGGNSWEATNQLCLEDRVSVVQSISGERHNGELRVTDGVETQVRSVESDLRVLGLVPQDCWTKQTANIRWTGTSFVPDSDQLHLTWGESSTFGILSCVGATVFGTVALRKARMSSDPDVSGYLFS
jgi:hypothetical protein